MDHENGAVAVEMLSDDFYPTAVVEEPLPPVVTSTDDCDLRGKLAEDHKGSREKQMDLGRNVHTTCLAVTEPESNDDFTGDKEAYMASVLARYRKTPVERTKHHLGYPYNGLRLWCSDAASAFLHQQFGRSVYREQLRCPFKAVRGRRSRLVCSVVGD